MAPHQDSGDGKSGPKARGGTRGGTRGGVPADPQARPVETVEDLESPREGPGEDPGEESERGEDVASSPDAGEMDDVPGPASAQPSEPPG